MTTSWIHKFYTRARGVSDMMGTYLFPPVTWLYIYMGWEESCGSKEGLIQEAIDGALNVVRNININTTSINWNTLYVAQTHIPH